MQKKNAAVTLGLIVGNRGFFPSHLCDSGRKTMLAVLAEENISVVCLSPEDSDYGAVFSHQDSLRCADLFKAYREDIDGILVSLPNFGEETAIANAIRWSGLDVPVMVQAFPDEIGKMTAADRRDSFCGKMSCCSNLSQYGIRYSLTSQHTVDPQSQAFRADLRRFTGMCRMLRGLRSARLGAIGARPAAFKTVRYSEKLLERSGISVETIDLSEIFGRAHQLSGSDVRVSDKVEEIRAYVPVMGTPDEALVKMARLGVTIEDWMEENGLDASALQCWTAMEEFYGVVPCTLMSMMSTNLVPSACETDIAGLVGMYAMQLAAGQPSAIVDWNNNYGDDPDKAVIFHCSNLPKPLFIREDDGKARMGYQAIIAGTVGMQNTYGTVEGRLAQTPFTFCRVSTDDANGTVQAYFGQGAVTDDPLQTFGGYGVVHIPHLQKLLAYICEEGFEHHVAINPSQCADILNEGFGKYLNWKVYHHSPVGEGGGF